MLVLTRKIREAVVVGGAKGFDHKIVVVVLEINGVRVRLGFDADDHIPVHRMEVWEQIAAEIKRPTSSGR